MTQQEITSALWHSSRGTTMTREEIQQEFWHSARGTTQSTANQLAARSQSGGYQDSRKVAH